MDRYMQIKKCLIVEYSRLPKEWKDWFFEKHDWRIHNDTMIEYQCEYEPVSKGGYNEEMITKWFNEFKKEGETLESFTKETGLDFVLWLIKKTDNADFDKIIVDVCW